MKSIKDIPENNVRKLAETLKSSGLAASETEAIRMAYNMAKTSSKATPSNTEEKTLTEAVKEEAPVAEETLEEKPEPARETLESEGNEDEFIVQDIMGSEKQSKEEVSEQPKLPEEKEELEEPPETTKEVPVEKEKPKKDVSHMEESKVDLSSMFKYKG